MPLLTFNVGLETAQLLALTIIAWQISIIARARAARIALAACAGFVAVSWIVERAFNAPNPLSPWARVLLQTPERLALVLLAFALIAFRHQRRRQQQPGDKTPGRDRLASSDAGEHSFVLQ